jgi:xanthine dehydrogenase molybdopterin-binding subunit B
MILADSREIATAAAKKIKVTYENVTKPVIDIGDALKEAEKSGTLEKHFIGTFKSHKPMEPTKHTIKGEFRTGSQYHNVK